MKIIVLLVCVVVSFGGMGCASSQKNRIVKQNDIKYADGTVDKSRYEDSSSGFALVGSASATRRYGSDVAVGTEQSRPIHQSGGYITAPAYYGGGYQYYYGGGQVYDYTPQRYDYSPQRYDYGGSRHGGGYQHYRP